MFIPFLQTLTNAQNRRTTVVFISSASIFRVLSGAHTTTVEKAVRVRNECSWIFLTFKKNRIVASAIDPLSLATLKENEAFLNNRSDVVKKGNLESIVEFSFLLIFINFNKREARGGGGGIVRSLSSERLLMRSSVVNCPHTFGQDCRLS